MKAALLEKLLRLVARREELERELAEPDAAADPDRFRRMSQEYAQLEPVATSVAAYQAAVAEKASLEEMLDEDDAELREMARSEYPAVTERIDALTEDLRQYLVPRDPNDDANVFLEIRAGTGGDEAAIFAGDLHRMYSRYAEACDWQVEIISASEGEHGGYKEIISRVIGHGAYSRLKFESGAHRVQRVPETESQGRIHTSAATVAVLPEVAEAEAIQINPAELKVDTYRASGAGGQHVNKTDSAVRLTHGPTNIVVQCQSERSQHQNRDKAWKMLKAKLYELEIQKRSSAAQELEDSKADIGWGSQIRSYVLDDQRIKDLRTNVQTSNCNAVLDGDLDMFIEASLKSGL